MRITPSSLLFALCVTSLAGTSALAQNRPEPPPTGGDRPQRMRRQPPEAAYVACDDLDDGDDCQVQLSDRSIEGTCVPDRENSRLFCMPEHPPAPPAATQACGEKAAGDACTMSGPNGETFPEGVCVDGPHGLHCRPPGPSPRD